MKKALNTSKFFHNFEKTVDSLFINKDVDIKNINDAKSLMNKLFCGDVNIYDPFNKRIFVILDQCSLDDIIDN